MSREDKIKKLSNAIRAYKGTKHSVGGGYVIQPQKGKNIQIMGLLAELGFDGQKQLKALKEIDDFKTYDDFHSWINELRNPTPKT